MSACLLVWQIKLSVARERRNKRRKRRAEIDFFCCMKIQYILKEERNIVRKSEKGRELKMT